VTHVFNTVTHHTHIYGNEYKYQSENNPATSQWVDQKQRHDKKNRIYVINIQIIIAGTWY